MLCQRRRRWHNIQPQLGQLPLPIGLDIEWDSRRQIHPPWRDTTRDLDLDHDWLFRMTTVGDLPTLDSSMLSLFLLD